MFRCNNCRIITRSSRHSCISTSIAMQSMLRLLIMIYIVFSTDQGDLIREAEVSNRVQETWSRKNQLFI